MPGRRGPQPEIAVPPERCRARAETCRCGRGCPLPPGGRESARPRPGRGESVPRTSAPAQLGPPTWSRQHRAPLASFVLVQDRGLARSKSPSSAASNTSSGSAKDHLGFCEEGWNVRG
ncbi:uncharacterized protein LOC144369334 [Ictidomys tridecemlineatus]